MVEESFFLPKHNREDAKEVVVGEIPKSDYDEDKDVEEIKNAIKKLKTIIDEKEKTKSIGKKYVQYSQQLLDISSRLKSLNDEIVGLANDIDPVRKMLHKRPSDYRPKGLDYKPIIEDLHNKIIHGTQVTLRLIQATYPEIGAGRYHVMKALKESAGVSNKKEGTYFVLFRGG